MKKLKLVMVGNGMAGVRALEELLRTAPEGALLPDVLTAGVSCVGLAIVVVGKLTIGRSFGIAPANRGIVTAGPYLFVRHPIYTGFTTVALGTALATGKLVSFLGVATMLLLWIRKIRIEEQYMEELK